MLPKPRVEFAELKSSRFVKAQKKCEGFRVLEVQPESVNRKKRRCYSNRNALIPINERMILRQALPKGSGLFDQILIVARLWPGQRRSSGSSCHADRAIPQTGRSVWREWRGRYPEKGKKSPG